MSNRTDRREAERAARKLAYQQMREKQSQSSVVAAPESETHSISEAQLAANRANAQSSTGPVTPEGRARSSKNALKHGLTGKTVLLPHEDADQYQLELDHYIATYQPVNDEELRLVKSQHDCLWRIDRIQLLESAILLKGHIEFADKFEDRTPAERRHLINAEAYLKYERQFRNLNIQEARLRRTVEKDRAELLRLQTIRKREEQTAPQTANGFEFSTEPPTDPVPAVSLPHLHEFADTGSQALSSNG